MICSNFNNWRSNNSSHGEIIDASISQKLLFEDAMELEQGFIASITQGRILNLDEISQNSFGWQLALLVWHTQKFMYNKKNVICYK